MYCHLELKFVYLAPDTSVRKFTTDFSDFFLSTCLITWIWKKYSLDQISITTKL